MSTDRQSTVFFSGLATKRGEGDVLGAVSYKNCEVRDGRGWGECLQTDRQTDRQNGRQTDRVTCRGASLLKIMQVKKMCS